MKMKHFSITGITIFIAAIGGVFWGTKHIYDGTIKLLEVRLETTENKLKEAEKKPSKPLEQKNILPDKEITPKSGSPGVEKLVSRVEELEKERRDLLKQISEKSVASLDPRSELSTLLGQLKSEKKDVRGKAIDSLFDLKDPLSVAPLIKFFSDNSKKAPGYIYIPVIAWYVFFLDVNEPAGVEFVVRQLDAESRDHSDEAYYQLERTRFSLKQIGIILPVLEDIAFLSSSSPARARAKILIGKLKKRRALILKEKKK